MIKNLHPACAVHQILQWASVDALLHRAITCVLMLDCPADWGNGSFSNLTVLALDNNVNLQGTLPAGEAASSGLNPACSVAACTCKLDLIASTDSIVTAAKAWHCKASSACLKLSHPSTSLRSPHGISEQQLAPEDEFHTCQFQVAHALPRW